MRLPCGVLFVGSGVSSSVPLLHHALNPEKYNCFCSNKKKITSIDIEKNTRNNVSLLIRIPNQINSVEYHNILIDLGKTFREAAISIFPKYQISNIDSILLTHQHVDATGGFNSILYFQQNDIIPIYLNSETLNYINNRYKTIMKHVFEKNTDGSLNKERKYEFKILDIITGDLVDCTNIKDFEKFNDQSSDYYRSNNLKNVEFNINGLKITAIPMNHGQCICIGYCFHFSEQNLIYISDYTFPMLENSIQFFKSIKGKKSTLVLDSISYNKTSNAHANIHESLCFIQEFSPDYVYFVGMSCSLEYNETNRNLYNQLMNLKKEGKCINTISMELAYDGLFLPIK